MDTYCWKCGIIVIGAGTFCESCGALVNRASLAANGGSQGNGNVLTLHATREIGTSTRIVALPEAQTRPQRRRPAWEIAVAIGIAVALLAGLVLWGVNDYRTHQKLHTTRTALALTAARLHTTNETLAATKATLAARDDQVASLTAIRKKLIRQLGVTRKQLGAAKSSLSSARNQISLQSGQISVLKTCLGGVNNALVDVAYGDYYTAGRELDSVSTDCNQAFALF